MKVGILTGGGDCPGLNPAIRGVVYRGIDLGFEFVGIQEGWRGLVKANYEPLGLTDVEEIIYQGGTMLGSSRTNPFKNPDDLNAVLENIKSAKFDAIVACGGDGTVGDVARGIYGTDTNLGVLPVGTGNDFARNLGIPLDVKEACLAIMGGTIRYVDVGEINGSIFINNAGIGFDSHVMKTMNSGIRFLRGQPAFMLAILKSIFVYKPFHLTLKTEDIELDVPKALLVSVLNGRS